MSKPRFFTKVFKLDSVFTRSQQNGHHWAGSTVRAVKVLGTNNEGFKLDFVPDPWEGHIQGLPLGEVRTHNLETIASNAVFENHTPQPGVEVTVMFTTEDLLDGSAKPGGASGSVISEGTQYNMSKKDVSEVTSEIVPADDNRAVATLQHKSGDVVYIGKPDDLADPNWKDICHEIAPGERFIWKNSASLNAKCDAGGVAVISLTEELI